MPNGRANSPVRRPAQFEMRRAARRLRVATIGIACLMAGWTTAAAQESDRYRDARLKMVEEDLVREGIKSKAVLDAMREVPRHRFVSPEFRGRAYLDIALPIGHKQTISPPFIVAYMTEVLDPQPRDKVLEIGTGSGFQAAVLSRIVEEVDTIEIVEPLGRSAEELLRELGYKNVHVRVGDGYQGWPEKAPFDKIIVTCSPEAVPQPLIDQLRDGGRMIIPLGERYAQVFYLFVKEEGKLIKQRLLPALFVPMTGQSEEQRQVRPDPLHPALHNPGFESDSGGTGRPEGWHYQRQMSWRHDGAPQGTAYVTFQNDEPERPAQMLQGFAIDGNKIGSLLLSAQASAEGVKPGPKGHERPGFYIHFYDGDRRPIGDEFIGPWLGSFRWKKVSGVIHVPPKARDAILRLGLNGGTGRLSMDDIKMTARPR